MQFSRRDLAVGLAASGALVGCPTLLLAEPGKSRPGDKMQYGLVTYLWGQNWKLPQLIANCEQAACLGVELRSTHAHGVEPGLSKTQRKEVASRFADSEVTLVGLGSNERFDNPDPTVVRKAIEATKAFIVLSHDVGSSGVKVKPDRFYPNVPRQQTIEQIGRSLNELGEFAEQYGQQVRLEVHGQCAELPTIKAIMDIAQNRNVAVCWNSNATDLTGQGIVTNFHMVRDRFGATLHVRELETKNYPYARLIELLVQSDYAGWVMLEASSKPPNPVAALAAQVRRFRELVAAAQSS
ncbi:MAG: xylose isomerase [Planctomycetaceae bacterium]|nr:xylose isomerase [Planctomycetaceae bacterium]